MMQTITVNALQYCKEYKPRWESGFDKPVYLYCGCNDKVVENSLLYIYLKYLLQNEYIWHTALQLEVTRQICQQKSRRREAKQPIWSKSKTDSSEFLPLSDWGEVVGGAKRGREKQVDPLLMRKRDRAKTSRETDLLCVDSVHKWAESFFCSDCRKYLKLSSASLCQFSREKEDFFSIPHFKICAY